MMRDFKKRSLTVIISFLLVGLISCAPSIEKHFNKGLKYGSQGKLYEAKIEFQKFLDFNPDMLLQAGNDCLKLIDDVLYKRVEKKVVTHLFQGIIYGNYEMYEESIVEITKSIAINPNYAYAHYFLGSAYITSGMFKEGIDEYTKAIDINPNYVEAYNNLAIAFYYIGEYKLAMDTYYLALDLGYKADPLFLEYLAKHRE